MMLKGAFTWFDAFAGKLVLVVLVSGFLRTPIQLTLHCAESRREIKEIRGLISNVILSAERL